MEDNELRPNKALIVVDNLECFNKGGVLEVPDAKKITPIINDLKTYVDLVIVVQEWHPENHCSFNTVTSMNSEGHYENGSFPPHGIANKNGSDGSSFYSEMDLDHCMIWRKGQNSEVEAFSPFKDGAGHSSGLSQFLKTLYVNEVYIAGLATEYCVFHTAKDAKVLGFDTTVIYNAIAGLDEEKSNIALANLHELGVDIKLHYIRNR